MAKRLQVQLLPNWAQMSNPKGPASFYRTDSQNPGALQFSIKAEYVGGVVPNPTHEQLIDFARGHGQRHNVGTILATSSGSCLLGTFGSVVFQSATHPRVQFWYLSNGKDFVFASHVCTKEPEPAECDEAQKIVEMLGLSE